MPKTILFRKRGLAICISWFIHPSKPIKEKYPKITKTHKLDNLVLIAEAEKTINRNIGGNNVCKFLHAYFEGVGL